MAFSRYRSGSPTSGLDGMEGDDKLGAEGGHVLDADLLQSGLPNVTIKK